MQIKSVIDLIVNDSTNFKTSGFGGMAYDSILLPLPRYLNPVDPNWETLFGEVCDSCTYSCPTVVRGTATSILGKDTLVVPEYVRSDVSNIHIGDEVWLGVSSTGTGIHNS